MLLQLLASAGIAFVIAACLGPFDAEAKALTLSGIATVPAWLHGFGEPHSGWQDLASLFVLTPYPPLLLVLSFCVMPPSEGRARAHVIRLLHCASWLVAALTVIRDAAAF